MFLAGKLLTWGDECWKECVKLLSIAEAAAGQNSDGFIVRRRFLSHCKKLFFFCYPFKDIYILDFFFFFHLLYMMLAY